MDQFEELFGQAHAALLEGDLEQAKPYLSQMMQLDLQHPRTVELQGDFAMFRGEFRKAEKYYTHLSESENPFIAGTGFSNLSAVQMAQNDPETAIENLGRAVDNWEQVGATENLLSALIQLADAYGSVGDYDSSVNTLMQGVSLLDEIDDPELRPAIEVELCHRLGDTHRILGEPEAAEQFLMASLALYEQLEFPAGMAGAMDSLGTVYQTQARYQEAEELHCQAVEINQQLENDEGLAGNFINLAVLNTHCEQHDRAAEFATRFHEIVQAMGDENGIAHFHLMMGEIERRRENLEAAEHLLLEAIKRYRRCGDSSDMMCGLSELAIVYRLQERFKTSEEYSLKALKLAEEMDHKYGIAHVLNDLAHVCHDQQRVADAKDYWQRSFSMFQQIENEPMMEEVQEQLQRLGK